MAKIQASDQHGKSSVGVVDDYGHKCDEVLKLIALASYKILLNSKHMHRI